jgi:hypothetical protein
MICSRMHNMYDMHNMQSTIKYAQYATTPFQYATSPFQYAQYAKYVKNMSNKDTPLFFQNTKNKLKYASQNGLYRSGEARFEIFY